MITSSLEFNYLYQNLSPKFKGYLYIRDKIYKYFLDIKNTLVLIYNTVLFILLFITHANEHNYFSENVLKHLEIFSLNGFTNLLHIEDL